MAKKKRIPMGGDPKMSCTKKNVKHVKRLGKRAAKTIAVKG